MFIDVGKVEPETHICFGHDVISLLFYSTSGSEQRV